MKSKIMGDLVDLLKESTIFQGVITLVVLFTWSYLVVTGRTVPQDTYLLVGTVVGFFFGGKYQQLLSQSHKDNQETIRAITDKKEG